MVREVSTVQAANVGRYVNKMSPELFDAILAAWLDDAPLPCEWSE